MNLTEPTQTTFTQAEDTLTNLMSDYSQAIDTKKGSVIRQLLIRPYAYIYAKMQELLNSWIRRTSVAYLSQSADTSDSIADLIASNYFVTRKQGSRAKGLVTLTCTTTQILVNRNTQFDIGGLTFLTQKSYIGTSSPDIDSDQIGYVKVFNINGQYKMNIPVVAAQTQEIEIPAGAQVQIKGYIAGVTSAELLSPVSGGAGIQTNAAMMERCKQRCGSAIGTLQAIRTKMQDAPVQVIGCGGCSSGDPGCFRDRYNNLALPMGGMVDVYVKTLNQYAVQQLTITDLQTDSNSKTYFQLDPADYPEISGAIRLASIVASNGTNTGKYTIEYKSASSTTPDIGARCTAYQKIKVTFDSLSSSVSGLVVDVQYMPNIKELQDFMDSSYGAYLGQSCLVKAAIPASLSLKCLLYSPTTLQDTQIEEIKKFLADRVNQKQVGDYNLNMDQIAEAFQRAYPELNLRLPYTIGVTLPMTNGDLYTFSTTDGTVSLLYRVDSYFWSAQAYFFSLTPDNIQLQVVS